MKTGNLFKIGAIAVCALMMSVAPAMAQSISVDLDRNTAGVQSTLDASGGETVQGAIVLDGVADYKGHTLRIQIGDPTAIDGDITYAKGEGGGDAFTGTTVVQEGLTLMSSVNLFIFGAATSVPTTIMYFDFTLAAGFTGPLDLHIIYVGDDSVPSALHDQLAIITSAETISLSDANFTISDGSVGGGATPTDTPTPEPTDTPTPTPTVTPDEPTPTPTETPVVTAGALILTDGFGGFHPLGNVPNLMNKESFYPGFDIVRDAEILPDNSGVVAIDGYGASTVLPFEGMSPKLKGSLAEVDRSILPPFTPGLDQYQALVVAADSEGYWVLNNAGQIFGVGSVLAAGATEALQIDLGLDTTVDPEKGANEAVDFAVVQGDTGAVEAVIVLTAYGTQLVAAGEVDSTLGLNMEAGQVSGYTFDSVEYGAPYFGWDIARDIDIEPNESGYMILDGFGGIHPLGGARARFYDDLDTPEANDGFLYGPRPGEDPSAGGHVYFGWDVAEKIAYTADGKGLVMLDALGGKFYDGQITPIYEVYFNFDIARDIEVYTEQN